MAILKAPFFENEVEKTREAGMLNVILLGSFLGAVLYLPFTDKERIPYVAVAALIIFAAWVAMKKGHVRFASLAFLACTSAVFFGGIYTRGGVRAPAYAGLTVVIVFAGLLRGSKAAMTMAAISIFYGLALLQAEALGFISGSVYYTSLSHLIINSLFFIMAGLGLTLALRLVYSTLEHANLEVTERRRVEGEINLRLQELTAIHRAAQQLEKLLPPDLLAQKIIQVLEEKLQFEYAAILLTDEAGGSLIPFAISDQGRDRDFVENDNRYIRSKDVRVGFGITGWVAEHGESVRLNDVLLDERYIPLREDIHSELCVPLRFQDRVIGVANIESTKIGAYSEGDQRVLETVAAQIAIALENAHLFEAERAARSRAEMFADANRALAQSLDLDTILNSFLEQLHALIPYDSANVQLLEGGSRLIVLAQQGYEKWTQARPAAFDLSQGFANMHEIIRTRASNVIADTEHEASWEPIAGFEYIKSWLGTPLIAGGHLIGIYALDKATPNFFTDEHRRLAESLAAQAAVAIQNARLFEEVRLSRDRLADLSLQLVEAHETETRAIGRELHDQIGQMLTALKLTLEVAPQLPPDLASKKLAGAQELLDDLMNRVSRLSLDLRPPMLDDLGLIPALLWHVNRFQEQSGIKVDFTYRGVQGRRFASQIETTAYRIVQESLTNVARHAGGTQVRLEIQEGSEGLKIQIEDNGAGFDPQTAFAKNRGLRSMRERVEMARGEFHIQSQPGKGAQISVRLPLIL